MSKGRKKRSTCFRAKDFNFTLSGADSSDEDITPNKEAKEPTNSTRKMIFLIFIRPRAKLDVIQDGQDPDRAQL